MTIFGPSLGTLWRTLESYGIDPRLVIEESDYTPGQEGRAHVRMSYDEYDRLRAKAAHLIQDPAAGLRSADHLHPSHFGALGYSWMASSSLLEGFRRLERFGRMHDTNEGWRLEEGPDEVVMTFVTTTPIRRRDEVVDGFIAGLAALCRMNAGPTFNPARVTLVRPTPEDPGPWFGYFRCPVEFASDADRLVISTRKATKPLSGADPQLAVLHDEVIERYLSSLDRGDILNRARVEITDQLSAGQVTEDSVALALNMSKRTLHRKLGERGESFRTLVREVRKGLVMGYLGDPGLTLTEIAFLLGYSDASSFSRAFRRWFGRSPSEVRGSTG